MDYISSAFFQKNFQHRGDSIDINKVETKVFVSNY